MTIRSFLSLCVWALLSLVFPLATTAQTSEHGRELIRDPHFQNGFLLLEPKTGKRVVYVEITHAPPARPAWDLAQWSSHFPLDPGSTTHSSSGVKCWTNAAKRVCIGKAGTPEADLSLGVNANIEYGGRARKSSSEPWIHLLVQQDFENPPALTTLTSCPFHLEARLKHSELHRTPDYTPARHAAQFLLFFTVANHNPKSPGYGQYLWFGIPVYDDLERMVAAYQAKDFGDTASFIYTPASTNYAKTSTHDGQWVTFEADLLPFMRAGLEAGWKAGFMKGSHDWADYQITGMNAGWEVPGVFDVELQLGNLSLLAVSGEPAKNRP